MHRTHGKKTVSWNNKNSLPKVVHQGEGISIAGILLLRPLPTIRKHVVYIEVTYLQ